MARVRRTKNIFNQNIQNQSLFQTEGQGLFKIGNNQIKSDWLKDVPKEQYIQNIYSSLKMAQFRHQLEKLKDQAITAINQNHGQISSPTKANLFKISALKKRISSFQMDNTGDINKINHLISSNKKFKIAQTPNTDDMLIQKITTASFSFFQKSVTRKVTLKDKNLIVESKKNEDKVDQWVKINLDDYHVEVDYKQKKSKQKSQLLLNNNKRKHNQINFQSEFAAFQWVQGYDIRLLLYKPNHRSFCLYMKEQKVQKFLKYLKFYNFQATLIKNKSDVFSELSNQLFQKVFTLFNNRLRMYDFQTKHKTIERTSPFESPVKNFLSPTDQKADQNSKSPKKSINSNQIKGNKKNSQKIDAEGENALKKTQTSRIKDQNMSQIIFSPQARRQSVSQLGNMSMFKLRTKKVTVNYDELQDDVNIVEMEQEKEKISQTQMESPQLSTIRDPLSSPDYRIFDFKLDLKEQGMSEMDEDQSSKSMIQNRKRTTNLNVSGRIFHQIKEKDLKEEDDEGNNFNINIHEIDSESQANFNQERQKSSGSFFRNYQEQGQGKFLNRLNSQSSMSSLRLQEIDDRNNTSRHGSQPNNLSPRSFKTYSSVDRPNGKLKFCLRQREPNMKAACYAIQMLYPYHIPKMKFHIMQIDPQIQMQKYQVICNQSQFNFTQKINSSPRYSMFEPSNKQIYFNLVRESNSFIFILKQQNNQSFYKYFEIDMKEIRYQRDVSQLILISEQDSINLSSLKSPRNMNLSNQSFSKSLSSQSYPNKQNSKSQNKNSYKFAAILKLYFSPHQIQLWPQLSTVQFLSQYISLTIYDPHYDFKHNFIERKKRYHQLKDQVNKNCVRIMLKTYVGKQNKELKQLIFTGLPQEVVSIIQKKLQKQQKITKQKIWSLLNFHSELDSRELKLLEESVVPANLRTIKMMLKPLELIQSLLNFQSYNKYLLKRIYEISIFFLQQNPFTNILQNLIIAISKQILVKLENVLIRTKNQEEVKAIIKIYLEVQYQIDQLFNQVKKYFL